MPSTIFDKIWEQHRITTSEEGTDLLHVDRSMLHDLSGTVGLEDMATDGRRVRNPALHLAVPDHAVSTDPGGQEAHDPRRERFVGGLERLSCESGIRHYGRGSGGQGITHVVGIERAFTLPGLTLVCGDSHTSTHGAVGALAWGIGSTETRHVLATQTLWMKKPKQARVWLEGSPMPGVYAKDVILWLIGRLGADWGREHAVEFAGPFVEGLSVEGRATVCNLAIEMGARFAIIAPDDTTFDYLRGGAFAPAGELWDRAVEDWGDLKTDGAASFEKEESFDVSGIVPQVTWGLSPEQVTGIEGGLPGPEAVDQAVTDYIGLVPGQGVGGVPLDYVFIGSCANNRIEDLRIAAAVVRGRRVAEGVTAWVVPGSEMVERAAEDEGLAEVFVEAGFSWRRPGCSMCVAVNGDAVPPGKRCLSTSNRNFIGRQGPGARTHLASPATAAASAIAGAIADPRGYLTAADAEKTS